MREIKFRAWDKLHNDWVYSKTMPDMGFWKWVAYDNSTPFYEYTGLKDKSGVEIYEGDLVSFGPESHNYRVCWNEAGAFFDLAWFDKTDMDIDVLLHDKVYALSVIGNIHENPDYGTRVEWSDGKVEQL